MTELNKSEAIETSLPIFKDSSDIQKELKISILKDGGFDINTLGDWRYYELIGVLTLVLHHLKKDN